MQLLTFGSRELKPNDQLHVNWKLASSTGCGARSLSFLSSAPKKIQFVTAGRHFFMINKYWFGASKLFLFLFLHKVSAGHISYHTSGLCGAKQKGENLISKHC